MSPSRGQNCPPNITLFNTKENNNNKDDVVVFLNQELEEFKASKSTILRLAKNYPKELLQKAIFYIKAEMPKGKISNPLGLLTNILKDGIVPEILVIDERPKQQIKAFELNEIIAKSSQKLAKENEQLILENRMKIVIDGNLFAISLKKPLEELEKEFILCKRYFEKQLKR